MIAAITSRPFAPGNCAAASAAGTTTALGWTEAAAWVSSKSREWPNAPFINAAAAGENQRESPNTPQEPPSAPRISVARIIASVESASWRARTPMPIKSRTNSFARSTTSTGISS